MVCSRRNTANQHQSLRKNYCRYDQLHSPVVALERNARAAVQLQNPAGHVIQEVAVVGDRHNSALKIGQKALKPGD